MSVKDIACTINVELNHGWIPLRVVHSDMKMQNILWDYGHTKPVGILDLDSVMSGTLCFDYGDLMRSVRKGVAPSDVNNIQRAIHDGFVEAASSILTEREKELLNISEFCVSTELALRYLTDYIAGDLYFKRVKPDDNIRCCRELINIIYHEL